MQPNQLPDDIPYERWVQHIFDHSAEGKEWWWQDNGEVWNEEANHARTLSYMTRLFSNAGELKDVYSVKQIDRGFNYIASSSCSNYMFAIHEQSLPMQDRVSCVLAIENLFRDLMAPVFGKWISHGAYGGNPANPNFICYMWWDVAPLHMGNCSPEICEAVLTVMENTLQMESEAWIESALHGLGHWQLSSPNEVRAIIDRFLEKSHSLSPALRAYALNARKGDVL